MGYTYKGRAECSDGNLELVEASLAESLTIASDLMDPVAALRQLGPRGERFLGAGAITTVSAWPVAKSIKKF